jgi:hypothetical protein
LQQSNLIAAVKRKLSIPGRRNTFGEPNLEVPLGNSPVSAKLCFPDKAKELVENAPHVP